MSEKVVIVGAGNMGGAIIRGLEKSGRHALQVVDSARERLAPWRRRRLSCSTTIEGIAAHDSVILAIPPQAFPAFAREAAALRGHRGVIISVMAGLRIASIAQALQALRVVRAIPNTPSAALEGMTVCCASSGVDAAGIEHAMQLLRTFGKVQQVGEEALLDPATALCGGGPAFIAYVADAMQDFALGAGFTPAQAREMTIQVLRGTAVLLEVSGKPPATICREVMTPGGTTERGIAHCDRHGLRDALRAALAQSAARSRQLGIELSALAEVAPC